MQIPIVWKMPNIGPPMNWALMYVTVGEERNQTWNPRERPVNGWLFRMFLNHIGSRGGSVVEWCAWSRWASLQEMADPNLFSSGLIPIHNCRYWYSFQYKGSFYLNIIIIFVGIVFKVSSCGWNKPHSTKKNIHKFTEFKCIPKECIYVRLNIQTGSSNSCNVLIQFKYLIRKTVEK